MDSDTYVDLMVKHGYLKPLKSKYVICKCVICEDDAHCAFVSCGHMACAVCCSKLNDCHICRKPITSYITIYPNV